MNSYPMTSTTFIRREIESLEGLGVDIERYAVRHWDDSLVDPLDVAEQRRTHYLLTNNLSGLFSAFFKVLASNPAGMFRALSMWRKVCRNSGGMSIRHFAYLLQAAYFSQRAAMALSTCTVIFRPTPRRLPCWHTRWAAAATALPPTDRTNLSIPNR
jgi:colanic acid/amylovoran biosynthesis glycosyltransferase